MNKKWLSHTKSPEEKQALILRLEHNYDLFMLMEDILREKYEQVVSSRRSIKSYLTQNWSAFQADRNATERTLLEIIELLPLKEGKDD